MTTTTERDTDGPVITLSGLPRRRHLKQLLGVRDQLALLATERYNHALDDAAETFSLMVDVEDEIAALFPEVHAALFPRWISSVAKITHDPGHYNQHCGICRASSTPQIPTAA